MTMPSPPCRLPEQRDTYTCRRSHLTTTRQSRIHRASLCTLELWEYYFIRRGYPLESNSLNPIRSNQSPQRDKAG
jgi:hypothetical protein